MKNRLSKTVLTSLLLAVVSALFAPRAAAFETNLGNIIHERNSLYSNILVYQNGPVISLRFGKRPSLAVQSQIHEDNPRLHMLEYSKMTFSGLLYVSDPNRVLVLGLGGGVIPREMRHYFPDLEIDVVDIDASIPPIATRFFGFKPDSKMKVHVDDGRMFVKKQMRLKSPPKYDIVVLDAFNGDYIPFHLMTREFLEELKGVLSDDGVVVANVFFTSRLFDAEFKTFLDVFGRSQAYFGVESGNAMLVSPGPKGSVLTVQEAVERSARVKQKLGLSFDLTQIARMLAPDVKPDPRAQVLKDDVAPVNWLSTQESSRTNSTP